MLLGPERIHVQPREHGERDQLTWVDDPLAEAPTPYWTLGRNPDSDRVEFTNHTSETDTTPLALTPDDELLVDTLGVTGSVSRPLHLSGDHTRVSGFDSDGNHWLHAGEGAGTDQIVAFEQRATDDYALLVSEGDETNRALTQGDEGELDAGSLGGNTPDEVLYRDGRHDLTGDLAADDNAVTFASGSVESSSGNLVLGSDGDVRAESPLYQQGNRVLDVGDELGVDVENTDGSALVANADAIQAGTDLSFTDDQDGTATLSYTGGAGPTSAAVGDHATASGDGSTTTFELSHSMSVVPDAPAVVPASTAASTDFEVTDVTADAITIEYASAPPTGSGNLEWYVVTTASGMEAITISDDDSVVIASPDDLNLGDGVTADDDGDGTVSVGVDTTVTRTDTAATVSAPYHHDGALDVGEGTDLGFTNGSSTVQFALAYDEGEDQHVWADRANNATVATVDRSQVVDFKQTPTVNGTELGAGDGGGEGGDTDVANATASGDDSTTTFALSHGLGATPSGAFVQPTSKAAMSDFRVTNKTDSDVVIQYHSAPPTGSDNLTYDVITHA